jgi:hypothetical protein
MVRRFGFVILALVAVCGLVVAGQNQNQNPKFVFGEAQIGYVAQTTPPQLRCEGGTPTGEAFPSCSLDTKHILGRSEVQIWMPASVSESLSPFLSIEDTITFVVNCNLDPSYRGPCWGTFEWATASGDVWEGTWTSPVMDLITYESQFSMVGHGVGGAIDGKQLMFDGGSAPGDWYITGTVRIK